MIAADPDSALDAGEERVPNELSRDSSALDDVPLLRGEVAFRLLVDAVEDYAIFLLGPDGRVLTWNLGAQRIKGYQAREIIGQHFSKFYPQEAIDRFCRECGVIERQMEAGRFRKVDPVLAMQAFLAPVMFHAVSRPVLVDVTSSASGE